MRRWSLSILLVLSCGDASDDDTTAATCPPDCPGETDTPTSGTTATTDDPTSDTSAPGTTTSADDTTDSTTAPTTDPTSGTTAQDSSSGGGPNCDAPSDCATCWACAEAGPCMAAFQTCYMNGNCTPSLTCVGTMCPDDGLQQSCVDTCCMSCTQLGTCATVDAAIACVEQQCANLCGQVSCP